MFHSSLSFVSSSQHSGKRIACQQTCINGIISETLKMGSITFSETEFKRTVILLHDACNKATLWSNFQPDQLFHLRTADNELLRCVLRISRPRVRLAASSSLEDDNALLLRTE